MKNEMEFINGKDTTSLPEVWVITGIGYDKKRRILAICPDEENADRGRAYYDETYDDVEIESWYQETFDERPTVWNGFFNLEVFPYLNHDKTYTISRALMSVNKKFLTKYEAEHSTRCDNFNFAITKTINQDGGETVSVKGRFTTSTEPPKGGGGQNLGGYNKQWLIDKINEKGIIKLVMSTYD